MKSQMKNIGQSSMVNEQKKSVFERLGNQVESNVPPSRSSQFSNRNSPYSADHIPHGVPPPPQMSMRHRDIPPPLHHLPPDLDWRYMHHSENRRHHAFSSRDQHMLISAHQQFPYEDNRQLYYDTHFHSPAHGLAPPPPPQQQSHIHSPGTSGLSQQRSSPKYDRHGNLILGLRERPLRGLAEHLYSPSASYSSPNPRLDLMRLNITPPPPKWHENVEMNIHNEVPYNGHNLERYSPAAARKIFSHPQQGPPEASRYARWRERRNAISTLDQETARSSSRTNFFKSSLQQNETKTGSNRNVKSSESKPRIKQNNSDSFQPSQRANETELKVLNKNSPDQGNNNSSKEVIGSIASKDTPADISDGEIVDDSSDEMDISDLRSIPLKQTHHQKRDVRAFDSLFEHGRKRMRRQENDNGLTDFENISDEEFDDFITEKETNISEDIESGNSLNSGEVSGSSKSASEIELLNAIGLDWANLVEMAKQSRVKDTMIPSSSARSRFSLCNYLPILSISADLAGPELYDVVAKLSRC